MGGRGFSPKSNAALVQQRDLEFRVRQLLTVEHGYHEPILERVEQEPDRIVCLFTVEGLTGRVAKTVFLDSDGADIVDGFQF